MPFLSAGHAFACARQCSLTRSRQTAARASQRSAPNVAGDGTFADVLVAWIARHGVATAENLSIRFARSEPMILSALRDAVGAALLQTAGALWAEPEVFVATRAGLHAIGMGYLCVCVPSPAVEGHLRAVASVAVWLERTLGPEYEVMSERELRRHSRDDRIRGASRLASPYVHYADGVHKRPDLLIKPISPAAGLPVAVEVELSRKSARRLQSICVAWDHCHEVAGVLYLAAPYVLEPLRRAIQQAGANRRIVAVELNRCDVPSLRRRAFYRPQRGVAAADASTGLPASGRVERNRARGGDAPASEVLDLVTWVGRWGVVSIDSLQLHLRLGRARVLKRIGQASREGLISCATILRQEGLLCWATRRGRRAAGLTHLPRFAVNYRSAHVRASTARAAALLEREHPRHQVVGLAELEARERSSSQPLSPHLAPFASALRSACPGRHRGPAILVARDDDCASPPIGALLTLGGVREPRLRAMLEAWMSLDGFGAVIVYVELSSVRRMAAKALEEFETGERRVFLRPLPRAIPRRL